MIYQIEFKQNHNYRKTSNFNQRFKQLFEEPNYQKNYQFSRHSCLLKCDKLRIENNGKNFQ